MIANSIDKFDDMSNHVFESDKFEYGNLPTAKMGGEIKCKITHSRKGKSLFGDSCDTWMGCFFLTDCEISFKW